MHNARRGEVEWKAGGRTFLLRPTFQSICALEAETGCGIIALAKRFHDGDIQLQDVVSVLESGVYGAGNSVQKDEIGNYVVQVGISNVIPVVVSYLQAALGSNDAHGE